MKNPFLKRLIIKGLHYYRDFDLLFENSVTILVGENGLGKTTVLNILYALLRGRWTFLSNVGFDFLEVHFTNGKSIAFSQSELEAFLILKFQNKDPRKNEQDILKILALIEYSAGETVKKFEDFDRIIAESVTNPVLFLPSYRELRTSLTYIGRKLEDVTSVGEKGTLAAREYSIIEEEILIPREMDYLKSARLQKISATDLITFLKTINQYLMNIRLEVVNNSIFPFNKISAERLSFDQLSSGEKQILYIFSQVYLLHEKDIIILFDEPELSLSLTWQRKILSDIVRSGKCAFLFAITHSPFVFDNELEKFAQGINMYFRNYESLR